MPTKTKSPSKRVPKPKPKAKVEGEAKPKPKPRIRVEGEAKAKPKGFQPRRLSPLQVKQIRLAQEQNKPYYHAAQQCYKLGTTAMKGANKWLKETFYPHYDYRLEREESDPGCAKGGKGGIHRGKLIDKQITQWAQSGGKSLPSVRHRYVLRVMAAFRQWGWTPVDAQIVVVGHGLGTAIDVLVKDKDGVFWAIELKTGFYHVFDKPQGQLCKPLSFVANTPRHHAMLQLAMGIVLYQNPRCRQGYVVRVDADGVFRYQLEDWAVKAVRSLVAARPT